MQRRVRVQVVFPALARGDAPTIEHEPVLLDALVSGDAEHEISLLVGVTA